MFRISDPCSLSKVRQIMHVGGQGWSAGGDGRGVCWELEQVAGFIKVTTKTKVKE